MFCGKLKGFGNRSHWEAAVVMVNLFRSHPHGQAFQHKGHAKARALDGGLPSKQIRALHDPLVTRDIFNLAFPAHTVSPNPGAKHRPQEARFLAQTTHYLPQEAQGGPLFSLSARFVRSNTP
jgi:hypothetical protein